MSHIQALDAARQRCETTNQCSEYETHLKQEDQQIDSYTASAVQSTVTWGAVVTIIGVIVLLTPFVKPFQKFQRFFLPKLAIASPILIGLLAGAFIGFMISFSACYKQTCSVAEEYAIFIVPLATLILTVPLARNIYRKRQLMAEGISKPKPQVWITLGIIIIALAAIFTVGNVAEIKGNGESQKQYLRDSEL